MLTELLKIKTYRAPRDKIICVLNCCKVIFGALVTTISHRLSANNGLGLLKHSKSDSSADSFMPLLIYVILQANPEYMVSNVQYILRFRNQDKLSGEAGYYLSSLVCISPPCAADMIANGPVWGCSIYRKPRSNDTYDY